VRPLLGELAVRVKLYCRRREPFDSLSKRQKLVFLGHIPVPRIADFARHTPSENQPISPLISPSCKSSMMPASWSVGSMCASLIVVTHSVLSQLRSAPSNHPIRCTFDPQKRVPAWASAKRLPDAVFAPSFPPLPIVSDARRSMMQPATTEVSLKKRSCLLRLDEPAGAWH
jgi:hypothetical protein